jgi:hypothetical protein
MASSKKSGQMKQKTKPDANAMFEGVSLYDRLLADNRTQEIFELATVCGTELGGVGADRKIVDELNSVLEKFAVKTQIPVTYAGPVKGLFSDGHPLSAGTALDAYPSADLIIAIGQYMLPTSFSKGLWGPWNFSPDAKMIKI